jgi:hypothetical protein
VVKEVKVTDKSFTNTKVKPQLESQQNLREGSTITKQDSCIIDKEEVSKEIDGVDEGWDDFIDDEDVDENDENWQPDEGDPKSNLEESMEPKAKKTKHSGICIMI